MEKYISIELSGLPKEKVIKKVTARYKRLLSDYEKIKPQLEELLRE